VEYCHKVQMAQLAALGEALNDGAVLKLYSGALPADLAAEPEGFCLMEIALPEKPWNAPNAEGRLTIREPWRGRGTREAGRGRLARSFVFVSRVGDVVARGTCGANEDPGVDLRLDCPSIAFDRPLKLNEFTVVFAPPPY
jgi:hypothetical protein